MQSLLNILENGIVYVVTDENGDTKSTTIPPTKYTLNAARIIRKLCDGLDNSTRLILKLQDQLNQAYEELERAKTEIQANAIKSADGNAESRTEGGAEKG